MVKELLVKNNIKVTNQRIIILNEIIKSKKPFNAINLFSKIKTRQIIDLATIYRVLILFKDKQIIREVMNSDGEQYFENSLSGNPVHPHFLCEKCHKISCLDADIPKYLQSSSNFPKEYIIKNISVNVKGICNNCA